jgi:hypothetical protein
MMNEGMMLMRRLFFFGCSTKRKVQVHVLMLQIDRFFYTISSRRQVLGMAPDVGRNNSPGEIPSKLGFRFTFAHAKTWRCEV